ncbi:Rsd/AlgQ family anti-sigma factor [Beggiatoa alba]|nr:Rsd/AlgQ family anti-sigma factor [Beggiatoa alba]
MSILEVSQERRSESHSQLDTLLETRKETLSLFNQLAEMRPFTPDRESQLLLEEFCEAIVDYTASAHFQLYRFVDDGKERRTDVQKLAGNIYPQISDMTKVILAFNEKYDFSDHFSNLGDLADDLSQLGEVLADRILLEDQLITLLMNKRELI